MPKLTHEHANHFSKKKIISPWNKIRRQNKKLLKDLFWFKKDQHLLAPFDKSLLPNLVSRFSDDLRGNRD